MQAMFAREPQVAKVASPVAALWGYACDHDGPHVALPHAELQIVVRFGASAGTGLDVHAMGAGRSARRKVLRRGQRSVTARLRLGACAEVLGASASELSGRVVALEDLWGAAAAARLCERLAATGDLAAAAAVLESVLVARSAAAARPLPHEALALAAAKRLPSTHVSAVAAELGVSERHLRRLFHETLGVSPKAYAKLVRFHRALQAAREDHRSGWARIAVASGYYDQAHLIAEFRAIAGTTPRDLLTERHAGGSLDRR